MERRGLTEKDIEQGIMEGDIFGILKCSLKVPEGLKERFAEFPPIFKNAEIELKREVIGSHIFDYAQSIERTQGVKKSLILLKVE